MKPLRKTPIPLFLIGLMLGLLPKAQAVSPPPDGGYSGSNTAEGLNALFSLNRGLRNTAIGDGALFGNTFGDNNTAIGQGALFGNTFGNNNTATGVHALVHNTTSNDNTATGFNALSENTTGQINSAIGSGALSRNTTGSKNTAAGFQALFHNTTGGNNTATGVAALFGNTTGTENTANGFNALRANTIGDVNSAIGPGALLGNTAGNANTAIGYLALPNNTTGNSNVALGTHTGGGVITANNVICIGHNVAGVNVSGTCFIGNIRGVTTQNANAIPVVIDGAGQLGTASSSQRFKHDIKPMNKTSEAILALNPVTFHYKSDNTGTPQFGLIAEEVAKVDPDLIVRDKNGEIYTVRYDAVNAMLLNEFLKEHKKVEEQQATITELKKELQARSSHQQQQIDALTAGLQKVSAQLEANKLAPKVAASNY